MCVYGEQQDLYSVGCAGELGCSFWEEFQMIPMVLERVMMKGGKKRVKGNVVNIIEVLHEEQEDWIHVNDWHALQHCSSPRS